MSVIVVSGGSKGLGEAIVGHRLARGDVVCTFARTATPAVEAWQADPGLAERFYFEALDLTQAARVAEYVRTVAKKFGRVDGLVNNAGVALDGLLATFSEADIDRLLGINLKGTLRLTRACLRPMLRQRSGRIVNITSIVGTRGYRGLSVYGATKAALDGLTRALAREVGGSGITVNSVAPGFLETEMTHGLDDEQRGQIARRTPLGRLGTPADVLPAIDFFLAPEAGFVTGQTLVVDGGITV